MRWIQLVEVEIPGLPSAVDLPESVYLLLAKFFGSVAGSAVSIAYMLPSGKREAVLRFVIGVIAGLVFGSATGLKIAIELGIAESLSPFEMTLSGAAAASLCAWWGLGLISRLVGYGNGAISSGQNSK